MPDFSVILQTPEIRALTQDKILERGFHDALFPGLIFRGDIVAKEWPQNVGDVMVFSAPGLLPPSTRPLVPGTDPIPQTWGAEQWSSQLQTYAGTIDSNMPSSITAIANLFLRNTHQLGLQAAQSLNRCVRNSMYNAAESGWTVANGAASSTATLPVKRLNGFTTARRPDLAAGSKVSFSPVSASNPLTITVFDNGAPAQFQVIGFTPAVAGDETGPGTLTLSTTVTSVADRAYIYASDATSIVRVGGGFKCDDVTNVDVPTLADIRSAVSRLQDQNIPAHDDGRYHAHAGPISISKMFADQELQRLNTSLPDYYMYKEFAIGEILGMMIVRNNECPTKSKVYPGDGVTFSADDDFAPELFNNGNASTGFELGRILVTGKDGIFEYYQDQAGLLTDAGMVGKAAEFSVNNNSLDVNTDRIQLMLRAPLNRMQDMVSSTWRFVGDWVCRTDAAVGDSARYKRFLTILHG